MPGLDDTVREPRPGGRRSRPESDRGGPRARAGSRHLGPVQPAVRGAGDVSEGAAESRSRVGDRSTRSGTRPPSAHRSQETAGRGDRRTVFRGESSSGASGSSSARPSNLPLQGQQTFDDLEAPGLGGDEGVLAGCQLSTGGTGRLGQGPRRRSPQANEAAVRADDPGGGGFWEDGP